MKRIEPFSAEVQSAASWQAIRGFDGSKGTPLPSLLSVSAVEEINRSPLRFRLAVSMARRSFQGSWIAT